MRKIKFRAWDTHMKIMLPDFDNWLDFDGRYCTTPDKTYDTPNQEIYCPSTQPVIMQFATKLFSGMELWEGDFVSYKAGKQDAGAQFFEYMGVVKFRNGGFCIYSNNSIRTQIPLMDINGNDEFLWSESGSLANSRKSFYMCKEFKVVGNIYENGCDTCKARGYYEVYHDDSELVKGVATCHECNGQGFVAESPITPDINATKQSDEQ